MNNRSVPKPVGSGFHNLTAYGNHGAAWKPHPTNMWVLEYI